MYIQVVITCVLCFNMFVRVVADIWQAAMYVLNRQISNIEFLDKIQNIYTLFNER
jgi:hypothetical protein